MTNEKLREALTPSGETKCAYSGEFSWTEWLVDENGIEQGYERVVPWTTIKEIMRAIRERADLDLLDEADAPAALSSTDSQSVGDEGIPLSECPPGPFLFGDVLGFKTEYGMAQVDECGAEMPGSQVRFKISNWPDAYVMASGETFWGGAKTHEARAKLLVRPVDISALSASPVQSEPSGDDVERVAKIIDPDAWHETLPTDGLGVYWIDRRNKARASARAAISAMSSREAGLREALTNCRAQFEFYVQQHLAKSPPDMDKAATNETFVEMIDAALNVGGARG